MKLLLVRHAESANNALDRQDLDPDVYWSSREADPALSERGQRQAEELAAALRAGIRVGDITGGAADGPDETLSIERVYCSAMKRSVETAVALATACQALPVSVIVESHEVGGLFHEGSEGEVEDGVDAAAAKPVACAGPGRSDIEREWGGRVDVPRDEPISDQEGWWAGRGRETTGEARDRAARLVKRLLAAAAGVAGGGLGGGCLDTSLAKQHSCVALVSHQDFLSLVLAEFLAPGAPRGGTRTSIELSNCSCTLLEILPGTGLSVLRFLNVGPKVIEAASASWGGEEASRHVGK